MPRILIVEDDRTMLHTIRFSLVNKGYRVIEAHNGIEGLELARKENPDLVILDVDMPGLSGLEVCAELRRLNFSSAILMLTGLYLVQDRVKGLNAGADDYLAKPFALPEFYARIKALLRRQERTQQQVLVLELGEVVVNLAEKTATRAGQSLNLTRTEFALLALLGKNAGQVVSRSTILDVVWGYTRFPTTRTVDTHIWRLRKKIGDDAVNPRWIKQIHGQGYCLMLGERGNGASGDDTVRPARD